LLGEGHRRSVLLSAPVRQQIISIIAQRRIR
jgi:hypothetical protein